MNAAKRNLGHPVFLLSVLLLLLNDWLLKPLFHNDLTGKLSDLAGLFAFPFFLSAFFPAHKRTIQLPSTWSLLPVPLRLWPHR